MRHRTTTLAIGCISADSNAASAAHLRRLAPRKSSRLERRLLQTRYLVTASCDSDHTHGLVADPCYPLHHTLSNPLEESRHHHHRKYDREPEQSIGNSPLPGTNPERQPTQYQGKYCAYDEDSHLESGQCASGSAFDLLEQSIWRQIARDDTTVSQNHGWGPVDAKQLAELEVPLHWVVAGLWLDSAARLGVGHRLLLVIGTPDRDHFPVRIGINPSARESQITHFYTQLVVARHFPVHLCAVATIDVREYSDMVSGLVRLEDDHARLTQSIEFGKECALAAGFG